MLGRVLNTFLGSLPERKANGVGVLHAPFRCAWLVEMLEPYSGRVYDPCCGSGGMFVQSETFMREHWRTPWRYRGVRAGVELHNMASCQDEPCRAWH